MYLPDASEGMGTGVNADVAAVLLVVVVDDGVDSGFAGLAPDACKMATEGKVWSVDSPPESSSRRFTRATMLIAHRLERTEAAGSMPTGRDW